VLALALSSDAKLLALGRGNKVFIHDAEKNEHPLIQTLSGPRDAVQSLAISPDGSLVAAGEFQKVWLWETKTWTAKAALTNQLSGRVTSATFTPDGKWLVLAYGETAKAGLIQVVEVATSTVKHQWTAHSDTIYACSISRDGKLLATGSADKLARLWELPAGKEKGQFEGHTGHVLAVAFNEDATRLASGGSDKELKIWDVQTKQKVIAIATHASPITGLNWTTDGKTLVSSCEDGVARTFSEFKVQTGEERSGGAKDRKVNSTEAPLLCVTAASEAKVVYTGSIKGSVYAWEAGGKQRAELKPPEPATTASVPKKE
jgi:WD40 repeat protein